MGSRSSRCGQGVPDQPSSLLLYKDKENAKLSQFPALAVQARTQCRLPGGSIDGDGGELYHHNHMKYLSAVFFQLLMEKNNSVPPGRLVQYLAGSPPNLTENIHDCYCRIWE